MNSYSVGLFLVLNNVVQVILAKCKLSIIKCVQWVKKTKTITQLQIQIFIFVEVKKYPINMTNIIPRTPEFLYGYWRPWKEESNYFDSYYNYVKDVSLAKYQADTVGQYIGLASTKQIQAIGQIGYELGLASYEQIQAISGLGDRIEMASYEQIQAISGLGDKIEMASYEQIQAIGNLRDNIEIASNQQVQAIGALEDMVYIGVKVLQHQMECVDEKLFFVNKNLVLQIEQQKSTNLLLENIGELLRVPDSEKERQHSIELGLKFFVNAQKDDDLFDDALDELLKAEEIMKQDYFVLHRIGLIYLHSIKNLNPQKALDYFSRAAKYASIEGDPKAARLANILAQNGSHVNSHIINDTEVIERLAADSYEKAAFAAYILGSFELAVKLQSKAVKYNSNSENYFMLAKYQTRANQIDLCIENLCKSIDETPVMLIAVFKDLDLVNEPKVLKRIKEKNDGLKRRIRQLIKEWKTVHSDSGTKILIKLKESLKATYDKRVEIKKLAIASDVRNWSTINLDVSCFRNGDSIPEAKTAFEWEKARNEEKPVWCYYDNDPAYGKIYGKLYNWYAVNDPRGIAPEGWHVPSDEEWKILTEFLGGEVESGEKIKSTSGWGKGDNGNNQSGLNALPGGTCLGGENMLFAGSIDPDNILSNSNGVGFWWSSTSSEMDRAWARNLFSHESNLYILTPNKGCGLSVRLLRD